MLQPSTWQVVSTQSGYSRCSVERRQSTTVAPRILRRVHVVLAASESNATCSNSSNTGAQEHAARFCLQLCKGLPMSSARVVRHRRGNPVRPSSGFLQETHGAQKSSHFNLFVQIHTKRQKQLRGMRRRSRWVIVMSASGATLFPRNFAAALGEVMLEQPQFLKLPGDMPCSSNTACL